ncbi:olfactory receptor 1102-like isoform X2 [Rhinatrema bivittatum]|uniref:olfactory receptor 1102-like isoform X2 n=1 Tax=Rhinatrema bivittatum TaxID=194408 RepID=UPI001126C015|nr:olfactory receptor 1102-like isoform X2 [Rhinatrema bivittatum]
MNKQTHKLVTKFILLGFTDILEKKHILFLVFLVIYSLTLVGNLGMISIIRLVPQLHTPMYFFLCSLSVLDTCYSSVIAPKMLVDFFVESPVISFSGCATQMFFFVTFGTTECFLLASMAYDRYAAICNPLLYAAIMSKRLCLQLVVSSYIGGCLHSIIHVTATFSLPFCKSNKISHFFCDIPPLLKISCISTQINEILLFAFTGSISMGCLLIILVSYLWILSTILKISSGEGRQKTFSTCASHITAVSLFYGTILFMYLRPSSDYSVEQDKVVSVFYTLIIPMLNPLIYSVRNKEVKAALRKIFKKSLL